MKYRIGSFNVKGLSFATNKLEADNEPGQRKDYTTLGSIIRDNFHIVALQEVLNENVLPLLFPSYSGWKYSWAQAKNKYSNTNDGYAFAWNTQYISIVSEPRIWNQYRQDRVLDTLGLYRHPYYGRFIPDGLSGKPFCEFRLISTHIRWKPKYIPSAFKGNQDALRQREFKVLTENILNQLASKQYGNSRPAYTFLLGDYNLNLRVPGNNDPYVEPVTFLPETSGRRIWFLTIQEKKTTIRKSSQNNGKQILSGFANNYDHFTYIRNYVEEKGAFVATDVIDTVQQYRNGDFDKHWGELSDHIPILLELDLRPGIAAM